MSGTPGGQGGFQQNQQSFAYNDGRTATQYQVHQTNWSTQSQQSTPAPMLPYPNLIQQASPMQQMLIGPDMHQQHVQLANQIHAQGLQHHAAVMQSMQQGMHQAFQPAQQTLPAPQSNYQQSQIQYYPSPQVQYAQSLGPAQHQQDSHTAPRHQISASPQDHGTSSDIDREVERQRQLEQMEKRMAAHFSASDQAGRKELQTLRAEVRQLAGVGIQSAAKDQRIAQLMQEKAADERRHNVDLAKAHEAKPQPQIPSFDMSMMGGAIQEALQDIKANSLSKADAKDLVHTALGERMAGLATTKDLQSAASLVQKELDKVSSKSSDRQIHSAMREELDELRERILQGQGTKQQRLDAQVAQIPTPWQQQRQPSRLRTTFDVTDLSEEAAYQQHSRVHDFSDTTGRASPSSKSRALPAPEDPTGANQEQASLTSGALARVGCHSSKSRTSKSSRGPVAPVSNDAVTSLQQSTPPSSRPAEQTATPLPHAALARLPPPASIAPEAGYAKSGVSAQPPVNNTVARVKHSTVPAQDASQQVGMQLTEGALARLPASETGQTKSKARLPTHKASSSSKSTSSKSRASVQPSDGNALARVKAAPELRRVHVSQPVETVLSGAALARVHGADGNAMASQGNSTPLQFQSSTQAMAAAQAQGGQLASYGGHAGIHPELPDDFPDTASQITSWERQRTAKPKPSSDPAQAMVDQNTVARRPKNDHRDEDTRSRPSGLSHVAYPGPDQEAESKALARQSKDVAKKSRR
ncbi:hypothetical protein LTR85_007143 [Meristemomyces frigidus]|nr:hypothetical protein LTR85_007143 [Meristemomyces frigidus]